MKLILLKKKFLLSLKNLLKDKKNRNKSILFFIFLLFTIDKYKTMVYNKYIKKNNTR